MLLKENPKETLKEMNRLKNNCSANSSIMPSSWYVDSCFSFAIAMAMHIHWIHAPNPSVHETTEMGNTKIRYSKSLTPTSTVANKEKRMAERGTIILGARARKVLCGDELFPMPFL